MILNKIPINIDLNLNLKDRLTHHYTFANDGTLSFSALVIFYIKYTNSCYSFQHFYF